MFRLHAWLAFVAGVLAAIAAFLFFAAFSGIAYFGLALQIELSFGITLIIIAVIVALIFYAGFKAQFKKIKTGKEALIGAIGTAATDLKPKGEVRVLGEFWEATSKGTTINAGDAVKVLALDGMFLVVELSKQKA